MSRRRPAPAFGWLVLGSLAAAVCVTLEGAGPAPGASLAQERPRQTAQAPQFRSTVDLVQVDVVAVDADGNHVRGLMRDDFEIFDRGDLQPIAAFEEVSHERGARQASALIPDLPPDVRVDVASNQTARSERLVVMVVDDLHIYRGRTDVAKDLARQVVTELGTDASMAVLFTSGERSTEVTEDRLRLLDVIDGMRARQSWRRPHQARDDQRPGKLTPEMDMDTALKTVSRSQGVNLQQFADNLTKYKTLQDAARVLGSSQVRRKAFVLISEGEDKELTGMFDAPVTPCEARQELSPCYHDIALRQMMEAMHRQNVTTYAIDPRGHVSSQELLLENFPSPPGVGLTASSDGVATDEDSAFRWSNPVRKAQNSLRLVAEASGGFAITDTDDFAHGLGQIMADLDHYYLLGFYPPDPNDAGFRSLEVRAKRPGLTLRFRKGYEVGTRRETPSRNANPLTTLVNGVLPDGNLPMRLHAIPMPTGGKDARVVVAMELSVPRRDMTSTDQRLLDDIQVGLFAVDTKSSKVREQFGRGARIALRPRPDAGPPPDTVTYELVSAMDLPPGRYQIRASATSVRLAAGGSVYLSIDVPEFPKESLALTDLVLGYAEGPRVPVARLGTDPRVAPARALAARSGPRVTPESILPFDPTLDRVFAPGDTLRLFCRVVRKGRDPITATVSAITVDGRVALTLAREFTGNGVPALDLRLPLQQLASGSYRLRVRVTAGERAAEREVGVEIRESRAAGESGEEPRATLERVGTVGKNLGQPWSEWGPWGWIGSDRN